MASTQASELNGGDDEDDALRRAIAMSLGESTQGNDGAGPSSAAALECDEEDEDEVALRRAIAMSLGEMPREGDDTGPSEKAETASSPHPDAAVSSMVALGLDRKKMEEERLARLRKRKAEPDAHGSATRRPRTMSSASDQSSGAVQARLQQQAPSLNSNSHGGSKASVALSYPKGAVLRTWARGLSRDGDIKIEEVFQKNDLELALLSSFQWDEEWLMSKLDMRKTKVLLVAYAANDEMVCSLQTEPDNQADRPKQKDQMRNHAPHALRFVFPPTQSFGSMHSKLQLLKYSKYLRIVVPTGNLVPYDWGETGTMENVRRRDCDTAHMEILLTYCLRWFS